jgi:hypothetical protein
VFGGLRSLPWPESAIGDLWRGCDMIREHRGDSHVNAWMAAGLDPVEINLLSEAWRRLPPTSLTVEQMGWSKYEAHAARTRLKRNGLLEDDDSISAFGLEFRNSIESATDIQERSIIAAVGDAMDELLSLLEPWARACVAVAAKWRETYASMSA